MSIPMETPAAGAAAGRAKTALVSMPWMAPSMPSIQLATLSAALADHGYGADRYELFLDYAADIGVNLYRIMGSQAGFTPEWIFSRRYFGPSAADRRRYHSVRPRIGLATRDLEDDVLDAVCVVTDDFLDRMATTVPWSEYAVVGFSLTISQLGASMAMARLVRQQAPDTTIVFGGTACAGPMGPAVLRACPEADLVVGSDGENLLPEIVRRIEAGTPLEGLAGVHRRLEDGQVTVAPAAPPVRLGDVEPLLDFDPYFDRLTSLGMADDVEVWLPFEGSRGCWYGEKAQCTFCGLHEIMKFRGRPGDRVLKQLDALHRAYGIGRFFAVDLILPREFHDTLLPELAGRKHDWTIFYEVKADLTREQFALMAAAGIRWVQPGIESLDRDLLRLMRKGVRPSHNIQLLRWAKELGVQVSWNLLTGIPGARAQMYDRMTALIPLLHHLPPPTGVGDFQLHRFSPYWDDPEGYGITVLGAHPLFRDVFPLDPDHLNDLVYWHDFTLEDRGDEDAEAVAALAGAARTWLHAHRAGAELSAHQRPDGESVIVDRRGRTERRHELDPAETALYTALSSAVRVPLLQSRLATAGPGAALDEAAVRRTLARWADDGLIYADRDRVVALATGTAQATAPGDDVGQTPFAYLETPSAESAPRTGVPG